MASTAIRTAFSRSVWLPLLFQLLMMAIPMASQQSSNSEVEYTRAEQSREELMSRAEYNR
eukprot:71850-Pyramimonas_sp.AAC.1